MVRCIATSHLETSLLLLGSINLPLNLPLNSPHFKFYIHQTPYRATFVLILLATFTLRKADYKWHSWGRSWLQLVLPQTSTNYILANCNILHIDRVQGVGKEMMMYIMLLFRGINEVFSLNWTLDRIQCEIKFIKFCQVRIKLNAFGSLTKINKEFYFKCSSY